MYYPYFRGRQNELACLRELLKENRLGTHIVPVIEPVRFSKILLETLSEFLEAGHDIVLIRNPKVGSFLKEYCKLWDEAEKEQNDEKKKKLLERMNYYVSILKDERIIDGYINDTTIVQGISTGEIEPEKCFIINKAPGDHDFYQKQLAGISARVTFIPKDEDFKDEVSGAVAFIENSFRKAKRNVDYLENEDEFFSKNHLIYRKRGYIGFSDYSMVGEEFDESGFAPLAVAIHIIYFDERGQLRIHHFVSDSNKSIADTARKFGEAMEKLLSWERSWMLSPTLGLDSLIEYYKSGRYPGLGMIKRCSMMHHLELMANYLEENA